MKSKIFFLFFFFVWLEATQTAQNQDSQIFDLMRLKWVDYLSGNQSPQEEQSKNKEAMYQAIQNNLSNFCLDDGLVYCDLKDMKNGEQLGIAYVRLTRLAKAYVIPNTKFYKDQQIKEKILSSLEWLYQNAYKEGIPEYGNWWHWEIGIPKSLNEIIALMYEEIPQEKREKYLNASKFFQPQAKFSGLSPSAKYSSSPDSRISTGGNRVDTSLISLMRGILMQDKAQVLDGVSAVIDVGEYVQSGDGFYKDSSFIQHDNVPYSGTYAAVLLNGLGVILYLTQGTEFEIKDQRLQTIYEAILGAYSMLLINGGITDAVSGRSISRDDSDELQRGRRIIESLALISEGANSPYKEKLRALVKKAMQENTSEDLIKKTSNLKIKKILQDIQKNEAYASNAPKSKIFWGMDRVVHQGAKGAKFVISMHSARIANYETMNGENKRGWHTGDGMTYIYDTDSKKVKDFWPTVDLYHLSGTTESIKPREDFSGERRHKAKLASTTFVGGVTNGQVTFAGMDFISWNNLTRAKKSWFLIGDTMIALGSNITSSDGEIHTTISNRDANNDPFIYKSFSKDGMVSKIEKRSGSWSAIGGESEKEVQKEFLTTYINHGKNPTNASYLYVVSLDNVRPESFSILSSNQKAHSIKFQGYLGIHFWRDEPHKVDKYKSYSTLSVLAKEEEGILHLWVSDPTQLSSIHSVLEIDGNYSLINTSDKDLQIQNEAQKTILKINNIHSGETQYIQLKIQDSTTQEKAKKSAMEQKVS